MRGGRPTRVAALLIVAAAIAGCSDDADDAAPSTADEIAPASSEAAPATSVPATEPTEPPEPEEAEADAETIAAIEAALAGAPEGCDPLDTRHCLLPFPSNAYTEEDTDTITDLRVAFPVDGMPANASGVVVDPAEWNRNDGFSPNSRIVTNVPGLDAAASDLPSWTVLDESLAEDAHVVIVDRASGERVPLWAEHDPKVTQPADQLLVIHPAVALEEGTTYTVGIRGLLTMSGTPVEPSPVFRVYRDALGTDIDEIEDRRDEMESAFEALAEVGVPRDELQLAWTFTTASTQSITERMLFIRNQTIIDLGDGAPAFEVSQVSDLPGTDGIARQVVGSYTVTNWLTGDGGPGNRFNLDSSGLPEVNGTVQSPFVCNISRATFDGTEPGRLVQYGHGLLGSHYEINAGNVRAMSNEHNAVYCATKWAGMSEDDIGNAVASLNDLSNFPTMADRLQQGVLNQIVLGRLMLAGDGLASHPAFQRPDGSSLIDTGALYYDGNSQGGIMGLMLAAVSRDFERAVLGVTGMNYSMLLPRSVDFDDYEAILVPAYPDPLVRSLLISMIQMLWDRGEGAGYAQHVVSDPLADTPEKDVLMHVALGDWQVTELSAMVQARTMGIPIHRPVVAEGRSRELYPGWGLESIEYPSSGSGLVVWDSGSDLIPVEAVPPRSSRDPHGDPRAAVEARRQKAAFLFDGQLVDVCAGGPCTAPPAG